MNIKINAEKRSLGKKSDLNVLRGEGLIPGIIYGAGQEGIKISFNAREFAHEYKKSIGTIAFFDIAVDGNSYKTFIKEKQVHPLTREIVHIDFLELHKGKSITIDVPINFTGEAMGAKEGGVFEVIHRTIQVTCLPKDIPEEISFDISDMNIGDTIHLKDLNLSEDINTDLSEEITIAVLSVPKVIEEAVEETEEGIEGEEGAEGAEGENATEESSEKDSE
ncbi:MAG: 50S ribosomal protein L25 [Candidatus Cloacimonetes bacterium]|jgi:large subunit ribosomal protein L25|nr:50S ribosomal protein L25 [Candidatus Cloacimonadota bacterium]